MPVLWRGGRLLDLAVVVLLDELLEVQVARWQNLIPSFPWIAPGWRAWGRNPRKGRDQILPSGNLHLKELIEEYDDGEIEEAAAAPENRHVRIENKNFFFSCKKNQQGR